MALRFRARPESLCSHVQPHIRRGVIAQNEPRQEWKTTETPDEIERRILLETAEMEAAVNECILGADPYALASEIGDVFYLAIKLEEKLGRKKFPHEVEDCLLRALEIAELGGLDVNQCVMYKLVRNDYKYPLVPASEAVQYERPNELSKKMYVSMGGEENFNNAYMLHGEELFEEAQFRSTFLDSMIFRLKNLRSFKSNSTVR